MYIQLFYAFCQLFDTRLPSVLRCSILTLLKSLNSLPPWKFSLLSCSLLIFFKIFFSKNSFRNTIRVSNSLDPDQPPTFVWPGLGPNCLQKSSADDTRRQRVDSYPANIFMFWKMLSAYYVCCIYSNVPKTTFIMKANTMDPDQTVPLRGSLIWIHIVCTIGYQTASSDK